MSVRGADTLIQNGSVVPVNPSSTALAAGWLPQDPTLFAGRTVILITHRPVASGLADQVLRLNDGRLLPAAQAAWQPA